jgi:hypothetical protein
MPLWRKTTVVLEPQQQLLTAYEATVVFESLAVLPLATVQGV